MQEPQTEVQPDVKAQQSMLDRLKALFTLRTEEHKRRFGAFARTMSKGTNGLRPKDAPEDYKVRVFESEKHGTLRRRGRRRIHVTDKSGQDSVLSGRQLRMARKRARAIRKRRAQQAAQLTTPTAI